MLIPSYQPATDENGEVLNYLDFYGTENPAIADQWYYKNNNRLQLNGSMFVELTPVKGLTVRSQLSANAFDYRNKSVMSPDFPTATGTNGTGSVAEGFQRSATWTWTNTAEYKFSVADDHHITVLAGQESIYSETEVLRTSVTGVTNSDLLYVSKGTESSVPTYTLSK